MNGLRSLTMTRLLADMLFFQALFVISVELAEHDGDNRKALSQTEPENEVASVTGS